MSQAAKADEVVDPCHDQSFHDLRYDSAGCGIMVCGVFRLEMCLDHG